jgi:hypothetical protein
MIYGNGTHHNNHNSHSCGSNLVSLQNNSSNVTQNGNNINSVTHNNSNNNNNNTCSNNSTCTSTTVALPNKALMLTNGAGLYKVFSTESVLNLLHCLFCKKPYKDPRLLHCGHTFCLPCLVQMNRYSTIRCLKCNTLQTIASQHVDTLPKNLFIADIQCIPTVEIDRGATYKETLKSLEELKIKLLDFSGNFNHIF